MSTLSLPSVAQLQRAVKIAEQIQDLRAELATALSKTGESTAKGPAPKTAGKAPATGKRKYTRKAPAASAAAPAAPKKKTAKRTMSPEGRARIIAAQKARWAKVKKSK